MKVPIVLAASVLVIGSAAGQQPPADRNPDTNPPSSAAQGSQEKQPATGLSSAPAEMKTQTYKGLLVDASCAMPGAGPAAASTSSTASAGEPAGAAGAAAPPAKPSAAPGAADRTAGEQSCAVSSNTSQFALKLQDGRVLRFDLVGNDRAQEAIKSKKKWSEAANSRNPINAKVKGVISGEKLIVSSIG